MSCYYTAGQGRKKVKNLGWLVRHLTEWKVFKVFVKRPPAGQNADCELTVVFENGTTFHSTFQSRTVCRNWLRSRRTLRNVPLNWMGINTTCHGDEQSAGYMDLILKGKS